MLSSLLEVSSPSREATVLTLTLHESMALSLRRPSMLVYGSWMDKHINLLSSIDSPLLYDRRLVSWVRLQIIGEDGSRALKLNDDDCEDIDISDPQTQFILQGCIQRLVDWRNSIEPDVRTSKSPRPCEKAPELNIQ